MDKKLAAVLQKRLSEIGEERSRLDELEEQITQILHTFEGKGGGVRRKKRNTPRRVLKKSGRRRSTASRNGAALSGQFLAAASDILVTLPQRQTTYGDLFERLPQALQQTHRAKEYFRLVLTRRGPTQGIEYVNAEQVRLTKGRKTAART